MTEITCVCEKTFEADIPDTVDLAANPEVLETILNGSFLTFRCPHCGHTVKPEVPLHIIDSDKQVDIFLVPEPDRNRYLLGRYKHPDCRRIVIGYPELIEKLKIYFARLDEFAIELIKYYILVKAGVGSSPSIYFDAVDSGTLIFDIIGLREDEIAKMQIQSEVYDKALTELSQKRGEEPYSTFLEPPYISISKIEIEEEE
jgi:hypothetical protein